MKIKDFIGDLWLACGVIGMAVGLAAPIVYVFYLIWEVLSQ